MNVCVLDGVSSADHHAVAKVDAHMTFPRRIIRSFKENKVAGLCFGFGNVLALAPQTVGGGAPHIVAVLVVDPANVDRKSTRLNSSHIEESRMPSSA